GRRLRLRGEEVAHALRELSVEPLDPCDLVHAGRADALERAEVREQRALALLADARDLLQHRAEVALAPQLAMEGDGEAVRLVAPPRQEEQLAGVLPQHHRVLLSGQEDALGAALDLLLDEPPLLARAARAALGFRLSALGRIRGIPCFGGAVPLA